MIDFFLNSEIILRLSFFLSALTLLAVCELIIPRRALKESKAIRWYSNLGIAAFNSFIVSIVFPLMPLTIAVIANERGWGLFNLYDVAPGLVVVISVIFLDLAIYLQHILVHSVPVLWRFHRMHHADQDFDVTTGARFHPIEIILSIAIKMAVIVLFGIPIVAVVIFEILLNATSMFNHANIKLPIVLDSFIRKFVVTPDMHRVHHSVLSSETNANFGFNLPWWDHMFGTYQEQPINGHEKMEIGIEVFRSPNDLHFHRLLLQPFTRGKIELSINRQESNK
jgi:sterol desaturase/sphingolipid hydroxylase (fatty acid hydroxylase superfamily)